MEGTSNYVAQPFHLTQRKQRPQQAKYPFSPFSDDASKPHPVLAGMMNKHPMAPYVKTSSSPICCYLTVRIRAHFSKLYLTLSSYFLLPVLAFHLTFPLGYIFLAGLLPKRSGYFSSN